MDDHALFLKLGEINGQLNLMLAEERAHRAELKAHIGALEHRLVELEKGLRPVEEWQEGAEGRLADMRKDLTQVRDTVTKGVGIATVLVTLLGFAATGFWWAIWHWGEVVEWLRAALGGGK